MKDILAKLLKSTIAAILIGIMIYCGYQIYSIDKIYSDEKAVHEQVLEYMPTLPQNEEEIVDSDEENPKINELTRLNSDIIGWINIYNTQINYPFVQAKDNDFYLYRDVNKNYSYGSAGTLFLDCNSPKDFSSFNTIMYGHHMNNGSMFGGIKLFSEKGFFDANKTGAIFLKRKTFNLEIFAYMVISPYDSIIYNYPVLEEETDNFLSYVRKNAEYYREPNMTKADRVITLSTCSNDYQDTRMVLIAKVSPLY